MGFANESSGPLPRKHFKKVPPICSRAFRAGKPSVSHRKTKRFAPENQAFRAGKPKPTSALKPTRRRGNEKV